MIWNNQLLFIHVPKTGGMSVSSLFLDKLPRPVFCSVPTGQREPNAPADVTYVEGKRHENLEEARGLLQAHGRELDQFECIIAVVRNPYEMEVSRYFYLRLGHPWDKGPAQRLALEDTFEEFAVRSPYLGRADNRVEAFYTLAGERPASLRVLRQEHLQVELPELMAELGLGSVGWDLPSKNQTEHAPFGEYLTRRAEEAIYGRFRWIFDNGYYARTKF
jgi:hypothetical protein